MEATVGNLSTYDDFWQSLRKLHPSGNSTETEAHFPENPRWCPLFEIIDPRGLSFSWAQDPRKEHWSGCVNNNAQNGDSKESKSNASSRRNSALAAPQKPKSDAKPCECPTPIPPVRKRCLVIPAQCPASQCPFEPHDCQSGTKPPSPCMKKRISYEMDKAAQTDNEREAQTDKEGPPCSSCSPRACYYYPSCYGRPRGYYQCMMPCRNDDASEAGKSKSDNKVPGGSSTCEPCYSTGTCGNTLSPCVNAFRSWSGCTGYYQSPTGCYKGFIDNFKSASESPLNDSGTKPQKKDSGNSSPETKSPPKESCYAPTFCGGCHVYGSSHGCGYYCYTGDGYHASCSSYPFRTSCCYVDPYCWQKCASADSQPSSPTSKESVSKSDKRVEMSVSKTSKQSEAEEREGTQGGYHCSSVYDWCCRPHPSRCIHEELHCRSLCLASPTYTWRHGGCPRYLQSPTCNVHPGCGLYYSVFSPGSCLQDCCRLCDAAMPKDSLGDSKEKKQLAIESSPQGKEKAGTKAKK